MFEIMIVLFAVLLVFAAGLVVFVREYWETLEMSEVAFVCGSIVYLVIMFMLCYLCF